jgi:hypothetical protein
MQGGVGGGCREASPYPDHVREGGVDLAVSLSAEGASGFVPAPRAYGGLWAIGRIGFPALRDGLLTAGPSDLTHAGD